MTDNSKTNVEKTHGPFYCNRFILNFYEDDTISKYLVESVSYDNEGKSLTATFKNSEDFFVPEYFEKYKYFEYAQLFLVNQIGENKAMIEFKHVRVKSIIMDEFNYNVDNVLKTRVNFTFKSISHKAL